MIYNITPTTFGRYGTRNGDLVAMINVVQHLRAKWSDPELQFYIQPGVLNKEDYIHKFYNFLTNLTDCFSLFPGEKTLPWRNVGVWEYRDIAGDHVVIKNDQTQEDKVVVFPLYDAQYNNQRNWTPETIASVLAECRALYPEYKKVICAKDLPPLDLDTAGFEVSTDFMTNIDHIMTAKVFYGGDTGVSHFASAIEPGPETLNYFYSSRCLIHTIPFRCISEHRGRLRTFWVDFEGSTWE